ncbi:MAG: sensor histidine kinase [Planctomycetaceae bacterium]
MAALAADHPALPAEPPALVTVSAASPPLARRLPFWIAHVAFWGAAFASNLLLIHAFRPTVADPPGFVLLAVGLCFLATAGMRLASHRETVLTRLGVSKAGLIAGGAILSAVTITLALVAAGPWFDVAFPSRAELVARLCVTFTMLATWCAFYFGWQLIGERQSAEFRALEAESLALRNELRHLQGQISPHFLFNALNTVLACRDDPEAIGTVTQALANYLRFLLRPAATLEPLGRELDALEEYLTIQVMRFGDGLEARIDCDVEARRVEVPPVMVQPLVENALKYGGQTGGRPLRLRVAARREGDWLVIEVANAGRWVAPGGGQSTGTGLHALERRLQLLVGPTASVAHREEDGWVRVEVRVPVARAAAGNVTEGPR